MGAIRMRAELGREDGNASVLTVGITVVVLMIIGCGAALTGLSIDRNRVQFVADGAALYATDGFAEAGAYQVAANRIPSQKAARERAEEFVREYDGAHARLSLIRVQDVRVHADGRVEVEVSAFTHPPLVGWISRGLDQPVVIRVRSEAYAR